MKRILKVLLYLVLGLIVVIIAIMSYVKLALPDIPAPGMKVEKTPEQVERGRYLANHVMVCIDCHATRDWSKYSGPIVAGTEGKGGEFFPREFGFPGNYYSANITPFNLGDWTDGEIYRAITSGVRKNGDPIFPVMPYTSYGKASKEDIKAVIAYLRTLPGIENETPKGETDFPMNFILNLIPEPPTHALKPNPDDLLAHGEYIVTAAACYECHTPFSKGQFIDSMAFAGGREFPMPFGTVRAPNLTPHEATGLGTWSEEQFISKFKAYSPEHYTPGNVGENEFNTIMPWVMYADMDTFDLKAMYAFLQSLEPIENQVNRFTKKEK